MSRSKFLMAAVVAAIAALIAPARSEATFTLHVAETGGGTADFSDGGTGTIVVVGTVVGSFTTDLTAATSNSNTNSSPATMGLSSLRLRRTAASAGLGARTLTLTAKDDAFTAPAGVKSLLTTLAASLLSVGGKIEAQVFINGVPGTKLDLTGTGADSGSDSVTNAPFPAGSPYTVELVVTLTLNDGGQFSGSADGEIKPVPAPAGLVMLATVLPFAGLLRRRLRKSEVATAA